MQIFPKLFWECCLQDEHRISLTWNICTGLQEVCWAQPALPESVLAPLHHPGFSQRLFKALFFSFSWIYLNLECVWSLHGDGKHSHSHSLCEHCDVWASAWGNHKKTSPGWKRVTEGIYGKNLQHLSGSVSSTRPWEFIFSSLARGRTPQRKLLLLQWLQNKRSCWLIQPLIKPWNLFLSDFTVDKVYLD